MYSLQDSSQEDVILIIGRLRHSYSSSKPSPQLWVVVKRRGAVMVTHCTCMAGLAGTCFHVGAVLYWVEESEYYMHVLQKKTPGSYQHPWKELHS